MKMLKTGVAALVISSVAGNAIAATAPCAKPEDIDALRTAQVQQQLMVAALSCNAIQLYNSFVTSYQKDLLASDKALQNFFRRLNGKTGTADYHAYKTRLANGSSMQSIGDMNVYCSSAKASFDAALGAAKSTFAAFLSGQQTSDPGFAVCALAGAPKIVPLPREKPLEIAQSEAPAATPDLTAPQTAQP